MILSLGSASWQAKAHSLFFGTDSRSSNSTQECACPGGAIQEVSVPKVPKLHQAATSACTNNQEGPKPGEHVQLFRMERNKGFYSKKR